MAAVLESRKLIGGIIFSLFILIACNLPVPGLAAETEQIIIPLDDDPELVAPYWMLAIGGDGRDYAPSFLPLNDGFIVVGMTSSYGLGDGGGNRDGSHDFLAVRLDKRGELIWATTVGGPGDERGSYSVRPTRDKGFLLTGTTQSFGAGRTDLFLVKLAANGDLDWSKAIGGAGSEGGMTTLQLEDGYIAMGDADSFGAGKKDFLVVKLNLDGTLAWAKTYGGLENDIGSGIAPTNDGYILGGTIWSFGAGEADSGLIKIDSQGNLIWAKTLGGERGEGVNWDGVRVTRDGGIAFGDKTASFGAQGNGAIFGIKLDAQGNLEWSTMVDGPGEDAGWTMNETRDGYIAGGKLTLPEKGGDIIFIKFDNLGQVIWSRIFGQTGLDEIEEVNPIDGGYMMAGVTRMIEPNGDFLLAWVDEDGFIGGTDDPISNIEVRSITAITPEVADFIPLVTDVTDLIAVENIQPTVTHPDVQLYWIARHE
mgnify:CR=1 FL=1